MYGAILGDMIGAPYEFDRGNKTKDFPLFSEGTQFTDDSVMTIAVAEALMDSEGKSDDEVKNALVHSMQKWGRKYPYAGYGGMFIGWLHSDDPQPYGSFGNGSAMRVSSAGWLYETIEETRHYARLTAEVTHNHPEGIKGAEATAVAIFLARNGSPKDEIKDYIVREFGYDLSRTCDKIRLTYHHVETCQQTVPEAITAFLEGENFEDVIRTVVSLGGDSDTLTCIAGGIAEAFYGIPVWFETECTARLPEDMLTVLNRFDVTRRRQDDSQDPYLDGNVIIEEAIEQFREEQTKKNLVGVLEAIRRRMQEDGHFMIPVIPPQAAIDMIDIDSVKVGDTVTSEEDLHFKLQHVQTTDGKSWLAVFTSREEYEKGESSSIISNFIGSMLKGCRDMSEEGIIINPWGTSFQLTKQLINVILEANKPENHIYFDVGDITKIDVEAIVNAANKSLLGGGGVDGAIHRAAGPGLLEECRKLNGCEVGEAKITGGWLLKANYVIHTIGPRYNPKKKPDCERLLKNCYYNSLELAKEHDLHTIAFPAISTGAYGYPKQEAAAIALTTVSNWLSDNPDYGMTVVMSCYDEKTRQCYQNVIDACAPERSKA